jgi:hypothetical protein
MFIRYYKVLNIIAEKLTKVFIQWFQTLLQKVVYKVHK